MKLLLVDGSALLHRAYHAYPSLTTKSGEIVGAVYGVASMLITALETEQPTHVVVAWDLPKPTFRHEKYIAYKAQRPKAEQEMVDQIALVKEVIGTMGVTQMEKEGYEADDIIGTLADKFSNHKFSNSQSDVEVVILTGDQDTMQLVTERVRVMTPAKGRDQAKVYGPQEVIEKYGVRPDQIVDYKALIGDSSDNIPGVAGIGPKTAASLIQQYESLDGIYQNLPNINEKVRAKLEQGKDSAYMSQDLSRIVIDMPIEVKTEEWSYKTVATEKVKNMFEGLNFKSLVRRLFPFEETEQKKSKVNENQMGLF